MRTWDFYLPDEEVVTDIWGSAVKQKAALDRELLEGLLRRPHAQHGDLEVAVPLARVVHEEYEAYGTSGSPLSNDDSRLLVRALKAVLDRVGITSFDPPFRDFETFHKYWRANDATAAGRPGATCSTSSSTICKRCWMLVRPIRSLAPLLIRSRRAGPPGGNASTRS